MLALALAGVEMMAVSRRVCVTFSHVKVVETNTPNCSSINFVWNAPWRVVLGRSSLFALDYISFSFTVCLSVSLSFCL